ncbi:MAG: PH domain-containing protein [Bacteroidales bacterium]|nr:PH domain-containing protein [Bacteroidales bacterium]
MDEREIEIYNELKPYLNSGEVIVWRGIPRQGILIGAFDSFMVPFSLFWGGFAFFWEFMVIKMNAPLIFKIFGIPFVLVGIHLIIGRFFVDMLKRRKTVYCITKERVIIKYGFMSKKIKSYEIKLLSNISYTERKDGSGTIILGTLLADMFNNTNRQGIGRTEGLEFIPNVKEVYNIIIGLQKAN